MGRARWKRRTVQRIEEARPFSLPCLFPVFCPSLIIGHFSPSRSLVPGSVIENGEDLIDQKQAPCSFVDSLLGFSFTKFCLVSLPRVVCSNISLNVSLRSRRLEVTPRSFPPTTSKRLLHRLP